MGFKTKAKDALAQRVSRQRVITMVYGVNKYVETFNRLGKQVSLTAGEALAVRDTPLKWSIGIYFLCRDSNGQPYIKGEEIDWPRPIFHHRIDQTMADYHVAAYARLKVNSKHFITYGWTATTGGPLDEETVVKMFSRSGVWD